MSPFLVTRETALSPDAAWARITDWPAHARWVPLTTIEVTTPGPTGVGTVFVARTGGRRLGFDDPMEVVAWEPPQDGRVARCRLEKRGTVMVGWAELTVEEHRSGSRVSWRESARPAKAPRFADGASALAGRLLFGRVLRHLLPPR